MFLELILELFHSSKQRMDPPLCCVVQTVGKL
jgi:hypothetical protein